MGNASSSTALVVITAHAVSSAFFPFFASSGRRGKGRKGKKENKKKAFVSVVRGLAQRMRSLALKLLHAQEFNTALAKIMRSLLFDMTLFRNRRALFGRVKTGK